MKGEYEVSIVAPAKDEEAVISDFIHSVMKKVKCDFELIIVNDGSTDKTEAIVTKLMKKYKNLKLINHPTNMGLGVALKTGIEAAIGNAIVTMDSDMTHDPTLINEMILYVPKHRDVAIASRYTKGGGMKDVPGWRVLISQFANISFGLLFGVPYNVKDCTAGYKAYRSDLIKSITIKETGFVVQLEIMAKLLRKCASFVEIPYVLENRKKGKSKMNFFKILPKYALKVIKLWFVRWT